MDEHGSQAETTAPEAPVQRGMHPNSRANLRPAWTAGVSGNPSGLTKDGKSPKGTVLRSALHDELMQSGGMRSLARSWVRNAKRGNAAALQAILERLDPIEKDSMAGKTILEGLRLELTPGGASLTMGRVETPQLPTPQEDASAREVQQDTSSSSEASRE